MRLAFILAVAAACGDKGTQQSIELHSLIDRVAVQEHYLEVARLASSCRPDDVARLITIAAGNDLGAATNGLRDVRCAALRGLSRSHPIPQHINPAVLDLTSSVLARPTIRAAIVTLLDDDEAWCRGTTKESDTAISPRDAVSNLLGDFPVDSLEPNLEKAAAQDLAGHHDSRARAALHTLQYARGYHRGSRAARVDEMVARGTPDAFDQLINFVGDGMPWNDGRSAPTPDEDKEIHQHLQDAFRWLHMLARPPQPEIDHGWRWDCEVDIRRAASEGDLGQLLMAKFERLDTESRSLMLEVLLTTKPRGFAEWRARIEKEDPDPGIRQAAGPDPTAHDAGVHQP